MGWLTAGLIVVGASAAGAQEKPDPGKTAPAAGRGVDIAPPGTGVDVNAARGGGVGIAAPGVGVNIPPAGSGADVGINVPAAGIHANVNPNAWRYRWHNNRWWFSHPNNRWSYWNNNRWNAYREPSTAAANNYANRRFSNAPGHESGYRGLPSNAGTNAGVSNSAGRSTNQSPLDRANPGDVNVAPGP
jgi:hypothetical protein